MDRIHEDLSTIELNNAGTPSAANQASKGVATWAQMAAMSAPVLVAR
jgi:hypothetical protein